MPSVAPNAQKGRSRRSVKPILQCTVRGCALPLQRGARAWICPRHHSYDIARSGYINLLQPQDRRSLDAGDSATIVEARARIFAAGAGRALVEELTRRCSALSLPSDAAVVDLGSGSGDVLSAVVGDRSATGIGIDLSTAAARLAARRFPHLTWVVANADRTLPLVDRSVSLILSIHGRRNPEECARALTAAGSLIVAVPAIDDLLELREQVQGTAVERSRVESLLAVHEPLFTSVEQFSVRDRHRFRGESLRDLLQVTYRGVRRSERPAVAALQEMTVTLSSDCVRLIPRRSAT